MKKTVIVVVVIAIVAVLGFACFTMFGNNATGVPSIDPGLNLPVPNSGETDDSLAAKVVVEAVSVKNKVGNIEIDNEYPVIKSFKNKNFENSINTKIASNLADYRAEISHMVDDYTPDTKLYKYVTEYERYNWDKYLTLVINQDYQTGGIRSNTWKEIYNIDVTTERIVYLADLFDATTDYEKAIIDEITAVSKVEFMGGEGLTKLPTYQKFYIKDGKLVIYFDPSEAASAKYGVLEYEMPFELGEDGLFKVAE